VPEDNGGQRRVCLEPSCRELGLQVLHALPHLLTPTRAFYKHHTYSYSGGTSVVSKGFDFFLSLLASWINNYRSRAKVFFFVRIVLNRKGQFVVVHADL